MVNESRGSISIKIRFQNKDLDELREVGYSGTITSLLIRLLRDYIQSCREEVKMDDKS